MFKGDLEGVLKEYLEVDLEVDLEGDFRGDFKQDLGGDLLSSSGQLRSRSGLVQFGLPPTHHHSPPPPLNFSWADNRSKPLLNDF